jgi:hypothetical protein
VKPRELEDVLRLEYRSKLLNPRCVCVCVWGGGGGGAGGGGAGGGARGAGPLQCGRVGV